MFLNISLVFLLSVTSLHSALEQEKEAIRARILAERLTCSPIEETASFLEMPVSSVKQQEELRLAVELQLEEIKNAYNPENHKGPLRFLDFPRFYSFPIERLNFEQEVILLFYMSHWKNPDAIKSCMKCFPDICKAIESIQPLSIPKVNIEKHTILGSLKNNYCVGASVLTLLLIMSFTSYICLTKILSST